MTTGPSGDYDAPFLKVSTFGTVVRTLALVEDEAALGGPVEWAFGGEQLLVVPRAGDLDNALYHRDSHSLQFYYFTPGADATRTVYSALSQDIVAHEVAHAAIEGSRWISMTPSRRKASAFTNRWRT